MAKASTPNDFPSPEATAPTSEAVVIARAIAEALAAQQAPGLSAEQLKDILASNASAVQKAMKPENATAPNVSAFNPAGGAKVSLKRKTYFVGAKMTDDLLTPLEIELFNRFEGSRSARNGKWIARVVQNGDTSELHINVPHKEIDDRMNLPTLTMILRELLDGAEAADPESLAAMVERQQQELDALKRQLATA